MSIFTSKKVKKILIKIQLTKSDPKRQRGGKCPASCQLGLTISYEVLSKYRGIKHIQFPFFNNQDKIISFPSKKHTERKRQRNKNILSRYVFQIPIAIWTEPQANFFTISKSQIEVWNSIQDILSLFIRQSGEIENVNILFLHNNFSFSMKNPNH